MRNVKTIRHTLSSSHSVLLILALLHPYYMWWGVVWSERAAFSKLLAEHVCLSWYWGVFSFWALSHSLWFEMLVCFRVYKRPWEHTPQQIHKVGVGEDPVLGKQALSKLNIETKPREVGAKFKKTKWFLLDYIDVAAICSMNSGCSESDLEHIAFSFNQTVFLPSVLVGMERGLRPW